MRWPSRETSLGLTQRRTGSRLAGYRVDKGQVSQLDAESRASRRPMAETSEAESPLTSTAGAEEILVPVEDDRVPRRDALGKRHRLTKHPNEWLAQLRC